MLDGRKSIIVPVFPGTFPIKHPLQYFPRPARYVFRPFVQLVAEEHEQPAEEKQTQERYSRNHGERIPVRVAVPPLVKVLDLDREVARDEADGQEENAELRQQCRASCQPCRRRRILLLREVEVLCRWLIPPVSNGSLQLSQLRLTVVDRALISSR